MTFLEVPIFTTQEENVHVALLCYYIRLHLIMILIQKQSLQILAKNEHSLFMRSSGWFVHTYNQHFEIKYLTCRVPKNDMLKCVLITNKT